MYRVAYRSLLPNQPAGFLLVDATTPAQATIEAYRRLRHIEVTQAEPYARRIDAHGRLTDPT